MRRINPPKRLLDADQAKYVLGALSMLIAMVGARSCLGVVLQQARSEIGSLLRSDELADNECVAA